MNVLVLVASCVVGLLFFVFAIIILRGGISEKLNRSCFFLMAWFAVWVLLSYLSNITVLGHGTLIVMNRALFIVSIIQPYYIAIFVMEVTQHKKSDFAYLFLSFIAIIMSLLAATPLVVKGVVESSDLASVGIDFGPLSGIYFLSVLAIAAYSLLELTKGSLQKKNKLVRASSRTLLFTIGFAIIAIVITNIILPVVYNNYYFSTLGLLFGALVIGGVSYSVVKHRLFDIRLAAVRSVAYSLVLITLASIYLVIAYTISAIFKTGQTSNVQIVSGVATSLLLAFIFQPVKRFFDKITNKIFYKDNYNTDDFFARLNKTLSVTTDLRGLLKKVSYEIAETLKSEQAFFFIYTNNEGRYVSGGTDKHNYIPKQDAMLIEQENKSGDKIILSSLLDDIDPVKRMMASHRVELILPLMKGNSVLGFLFLGEHLASGYTNRDIKALSTLSDALIVAIQNALAINEIREINATLQQKIANATKELRSKNAILLQLDKIKDEFISMASHQLRTPLTSVKGYLSMVIEGDAGKVSPSQKQLLNQAYISSENMVHLINDFLNVSRIQAGKFIIDRAPVDLSELVEQEISSLRPNAEARGMKFEYKKPKKFPIIDLDEGKIRQVIMNFADNAIYYSHDKSTITISLSVEGRNAVFTVKDSGIGVPAKEKEHLFSKFYRASNAKIQRPDGTGVGIFLSKRVVNEHGGEIIFESTEGKGSTFGFRLPIPPVK